MELITQEPHRQRLKSIEFRPPASDGTNVRRYACRHVVMFRTRCAETPHRGTRKQDDRLRHFRKSLTKLPSAGKQVCDFSVRLDVSAREIGINATGFNDSLFGTPRIKTLIRAHQFMTICASRGTRFVRTAHVTLLHPGKPREGDIAGKNHCGPEIDNAIPDADAAMLRSHRQRRKPILNWEYTGLSINEKQFLGQVARIDSGCADCETVNSW